MNLFMMLIEEPIIFTEVALDIVMHWSMFLHTLWEAYIFDILKDS